MVIKFALGVCMSHCLKKMFNATTKKGYDFWYYQSLLEKPYTDLIKYFNVLIRKKEEMHVRGIAILGLCCANDDGIC